MAGNNEELSETITLVDEEGKEHDFFLVDSFQVDARQYAVLVPIMYQEESAELTEDDELSDEAYIFRIEMVDGEEVLVEVEEEEEWSRVAQEYESRQKRLEQEEDADLL